MRNLAKHLPDSSGFDLKHILVEPGKPISLKKDFDPAYSGNFKDKEETLTELRLNIEQLACRQDILYANDTYALLVVLQALDAAGKGSTIQHVMWGALVAKQHLPPRGKDQSIWKKRFEEINCFERYLVDNGIIVLKLFLNVSKKEQKVRFLKRIDEKEKNWKFSSADALERRHWEEYMAAYEDMLTHPSPDWAPWFVVPADHKWFTRLCVSEIVVATLKSLGLKYPKIGDE